MCEAVSHQGVADWLEILGLKDTCRFPQQRMSAAAFANEIAVIV